MIDSPEALNFNPTAFDDNFFAAYEVQLVDISLAEQASIALADILTIEKADGTQKSYEELRYETSNFFANDWVRNDEALMNRMAREFAQACMGHQHGDFLAQDSFLNPMFEKGSDSIAGKKHDHKNESHSDSDDDEEYEVDARTGKKTKKKRRG